MPPMPVIVAGLVIESTYARMRAWVRLQARGISTVAGSCSWQGGAGERAASATLPMALRTMALLPMALLPTALISRSAYRVGGHPRIAVGGGHRDAVEQCAVRCAC